MKIVIDGRFWGPGHTGLGVYTQELVENLLKIDKKNHYVVLRHSIPAYSLREQLIVPLLLYRERSDLVHFPSINVPIFYFGKFVVTVHDLIKHESRGSATTTHHPLVYWPKYFLYLFVVWWTVHRAVKILVPSQKVKDKLLKAYRLDPNKIVVTYEAAVLSPSQASGRPNLPTKFAIYTGNAYPHKNLPRLISAWKTVYAKTKTKLVISSSRSHFTQKIIDLIAQAKAQSYVQFSGYLSDNDLATAYTKAQTFVFPSLAEGFGIPGLDAMKFGLPIVCSDIPVLHEIYGPAATYFDPKSETDMIQKITSVLTNQNLQAKLAKLGRTQVAKYSWQKTAFETLRVYESCFGLRSG